MSASPRPLPTTTKGRLIGNMEALGFRVEIMLDATRRYEQPLTAERLFGWHVALFPTGHSIISRITAGAWRTGEHKPMQVVSGPIGHETVHFEAPEVRCVAAEMNAFLE